MALFLGSTSKRGLTPINLNYIVTNLIVNRGQTPLFLFVSPIHLAAAVEAGCEVFLTNDFRLARFTDLTVEVLP